jgi:hypothetical protein
MVGGTMLLDLAVEAPPACNDNTTLLRLADTFENTMECPTNKPSEVRLK